MRRLQNCVGKIKSNESLYTTHTLDQIIGHHTHYRGCIKRTIWVCKEFPAQGYGKVLIDRSHLHSTALTFSTVSPTPAETSISWSTIIVYRSLDRIREDDSGIELAHGKYDNLDPADPNRKTTSQATIMTDIQLHEIDSNWSESIDDPLSLYESTDPQSETGLFVINPGERVPEEGTTSHGGDEISLILSGEIEVVTEDSHTVGEGMLSVIPAGVEHYSVNHGDEPVKLVYTILGDL